MNALDEFQISRWQERLAKAQADAASWQIYAAEDQSRTPARKEMSELLQQFLSGQCDTPALRDTFDRKTRAEWSKFGFKGLSAMFLNILVKYIADAETVAAELRSVLPVPKDVPDGRQRMQAFADYLNGLIEAGTVQKATVQPVRIPFFVSAWWHVQDTEHWPVYYLSGRQVLEQESDFCAQGDPVADYFAFREHFLALASGLGLNSWTCEHMLDWLNRFGHEEKPPVIDPPPPDPEPEKEAEPKHTQIQWLLAKIGQKLGCKVWIAANDQSRQWDGQKLADLSIPNLPTLGLDEESQKVVRLIDVVWLKGTHQVAAAFEIEQTTSIYSGLLRMCDLVALSPNLNFPLYLVAPDSRMEQVRTQLSRPTFQSLEMHKRCGFFSCESLLKNAESILRWASSPAVIDQLASKVGDTKAQAPSQ